MAEEQAQTPPSPTPSYVIGKSFLYGSASQGVIFIGVVWATFALIGLVGFLQHFSIMGLILAGICGFFSYQLAAAGYGDFLEWLRQTSLRKRYKELPWWPLRALGVLATITILGIIATTLLVSGGTPAKTHAILAVGFTATSPLAALVMYRAFYVRTPKLTCPTCGTNIDTDRQWKCMTCRPWTVNLGGISNSFLGECFKCLRPPEYVECPAPECHALVLLDNPDETIVKPEDTRRLHRCRLVLGVGEAETPEDEDLRDVREKRTRYETIQEVKQEQEKMYDIQHEVRVHASDEADDLRQKQEERAKAEKASQARQEEQTIQQLLNRVQNVDRPEAKSAKEKMKGTLEKVLEQKMNRQMAMEEIKSEIDSWDYDWRMKEILKSEVDSWGEDELRKYMDKGK